MKRNKYQAVLYAAGFVLVPTILFAIKDRLYLPGCVFKKLTGLYCPGCGIRRGIDALTRGDIITSFRAYPPLVFMILLYVVTCMMIVHEKASGRTFRVYLYSTTILAFIIIVLVISNWIINNLPILQNFAR